MQSTSRVEIIGDDLIDLDLINMSRRNIDIFQTLCSQENIYIHIRSFYPHACITVSY